MAHIITSGKNHYLLNKLNELLKIGDTDIQKITLHTNNNLHQQILLGQTALIHQHTHSLILLCQNGFPESATPISRASFESITILKYIFSEDTDYRSKSFIIHENKDKRKNTLQIINLYESDKSLEGDFLSKQELKSLLASIDNDIKQIETIEGKSLNWEDRLVVRLQSLDKLNKNRVWEFLYRVIYWQISHISHSTSRAIINMAFLNSKNGKITINLGSHLEGLEVLINMQYIIYRELLGMLSNEFGEPTAGVIKDFPLYIPPYEFER